MLQNGIYRGEIVHKENAYPGLHDPIIDETLWDEVQATLAQNRVERATRSAATTASLLAGLVYDSSGERMSPTHANKKGIRYRYYVSQSLIKRGRPAASTTACRVPASDLEALVEERILTLLKDRSVVLNAAETVSISERKALLEQSQDLTRRWTTLSASHKGAIIRAIVARVAVRPDKVEISICPSMLWHVSKQDLDLRRFIGQPTGSIEVVSVPACVRRAGMETRLLIDGAPLGQREPDRSLLRLLGQARRFTDMIIENPGMSVVDLAAKAGVSQSYFTRVFRLSFLAPEITIAILHGRQPPELTANKLMQTGALRPFWPDQHRQLGFK